MINYGDWRNLPDYRDGWQDKNSSPIGQIARVLDPTTYIPGLNKISEPVHNLATKGIEAGNRVLSPVVQVAHKITDTITPGLTQARKAIPMLDSVNRFTENKPVDALGIAAATYFSGGAAGGLFGGGAGAGTASAAAPLGAAGTQAATSAITPAALTAGETALASAPAASSGLGFAGTQAGLSALTPASMAAPEAAGAGSLLGATGTQAALSSLTPGSGGFLSSLKPAFEAARTGKRYADNINRFASPDNDNNYAAENSLAAQIINDKPEPAKVKKRVINEIMKNKYGLNTYFNRGY